MNTSPGAIDVKELFEKVAELERMHSRIAEELAALQVSASPAVEQSNISTPATLFKRFEEAGDHIGPGASRGLREGGQASSVSSAEIAPDVNTQGPTIFTATGLFNVAVDAEGLDGALPINAHARTGAAITVMSDNSIMGSGALEVRSPRGLGTFSNGGGLGVLASANGEQSVGVIGVGGRVGVEAQPTSANGVGVHALSSGVSFSSPNPGSAGVFAEGGSFPGVYATSDYIGVFATGTSAIGVFGSSESAAGVIGSSQSQAGIVGLSGSNVGVGGSSESAAGVVGSSQSGVGVFGSSDSDPGVFGSSNSNAGVFGSSQSSAGVVGRSQSQMGVFGASESIAGVLGNSQTAAGVFGASNSGPGVVAESLSGPALVIVGHVQLQSDAVGQAVLQAGTQSLTVPTSAATSSSQILLTPLSDPQGRLWVTRATGSFTINASVAPANDVTISYLIIN